MPLKLEDIVPDPEPDLTAYRRQVHQVGVRIAQRHGMCSAWEEVLDQLDIPRGGIPVQTVQVSASVVTRTDVPLTIPVAELAGLTHDEQVAKVTEMVKDRYPGSVEVTDLSNVESVNGLVLPPGWYPCYITHGFLAHLTDHPEWIDDPSVTRATMLCRPTPRDRRLYSAVQRPNNSRSGHWCGTCVDRAIPLGGIRQDDIQVRY